MARSTINVEALSATLHDTLVHWKRHVVPRRITHHAGIKVRVIAHLPTRYGSFDGRAGRPQIGIELAPGKRLQPRLVMHVLAAASQQQSKCQGTRSELSEGRHSLARDLRNGPWIQAPQPLPCSRRIVLRIGRENDEEEAVARGK